METVSLAFRRIIRAPRDFVFQAWTRPDLLVRWWGPEGVFSPGAEIDLREGGAYRIGNRLPDGTTTWIWGRFERVRAPEELIYSWNIEDAPGAASLVRVLFLDHSVGTELRLTHERVAAAAREIHEGGWKGCLEGLERLARDRTYDKSATLVR